MVRDHKIRNDKTKEDDDAKSSTMSRVGIIGLGHMGILHSAIVNSLRNESVVALCDKDPLLTKVGSKIVPELHFYTNCCISTPTITQVTT